MENHRSTDRPAPSGAGRARLIGAGNPCWDVVPPRWTRPVRQQAPCPSPSGLSFAHIFQGAHRERRHDAVRPLRWEPERRRAAALQMPDRGAWLPGDVFSGVRWLDTAFASRGASTTPAPLEMWAKLSPQGDGGRRGPPSGGRSRTGEARARVASGRHRGRYTEGRGPHPLGLAEPRPSALSRRERADVATGREKPRCAPP